MSTGRGPIDIGEILVCRPREADAPPSLYCTRVLRTPMRKRRKPDLCTHTRVGTNACEHSKPTQTTLVTYTHHTLREDATSEPCAAQTSPQPRRAGCVKQKRMHL